MYCLKAFQRFYTIIPLSHIPYNKKYVLTVCKGKDTLPDVFNLPVPWFLCLRLDVMCRILWLHLLRYSVESSQTAFLFLSPSRAHFPHSPSLRVAAPRA